MTANQIQLQFAKLRVFDAHVGKFPETGVDPIDSATFRNDLFDDAPRSFDALMRVGGKCDVLFTARHGGNLRQRQSLAVYFKHEDKKAEVRSQKKRSCSSASVMKPGRGHLS